MHQSQLRESEMRPICHPYLENKNKQGLHGDMGKPLAIKSTVRGK